MTKKMTQTPGPDAKEEMEKPDFEPETAQEDGEYKDAEQILSMNEQANVILEKARAKGIEHTFMFTTTFQRYVELIFHMAELQKAIKGDGCLVTKEYVKGRKNIYVHPAINAYNATAAQANNTANILMRFIVQPLSDGDDKDDFDMF